MFTTSQTECQSHQDPNLRVGTALTFPFKQIIAYIFVKALTFHFKNNIFLLSISKMLTRYADVGHEK